MPRIDLPENYSVNLARQALRDSLLSHGEECIALQMYHIGQDENKAERCPQCYDDFYKQSDISNCPDCYGTTFAGGIKLAVRVRAIFTDHVVAEQIGQNGVWTPDQRDVQIEPFPALTEHDFIVRVRMWDAQHRPLEIEGFYGVQQVTRNSLRTGNRFGQWQADVVGQKATITKLQKNSPICSYPVLGVQFPVSQLDRGVQIPTVKNTTTTDPQYYLTGITKSEKGEKGDPGDAATITVGTTTTGEPGSLASVVNLGSSSSAILNFSIPRGEDGTAATISIGQVTTGLAGSPASVTNSGTSSAAVLDFSIPRGDKAELSFYSGVLNAPQDGTITVFDLPETALAPNKIEVYRNGLREVNGVGFTATSTQLTFSTPPLTTDVIEVSYQT